MPGMSYLDNSREQHWDQLITTLFFTMANKSNLTLKPFENSNLYRRRMEDRTKLNPSETEELELQDLLQNLVDETSGTIRNRPLPKIPPFNTVDISSNETYDAGCLPKLSLKNLKVNALYGEMYKNTRCVRCDDGFEPHEKIVNTNGELWHPQCFVCAQCFRSFPEGIFYEFEGRKYCEHDFQMLFAPCCGRCGEFIIGRVIKAMNANWHPKCFLCEMCNKELADLGFIRYQNKALCHDCNARAKAASLGKHVCHKCHSMIDDRPLRFRGEVYHPYHFNCSSCGIELNADAREVKSRPGFTANEMNELYCLRCHDKMGIPICGACRRPIEERVVTALGKHFHVEHFVCAKCEKPFLGNRHYEKKGLAYCETHYHQLFGNLCFVCNQVIGGDVFTALNKAWCVHHFACSVCDTKMSQKTKFYEFDLKPTCKKCFDKFPAELRKRLKKAYEASPRKSSATN